jgi:hypothetical protein
MVVLPTFTFPLDREQQRTADVGSSPSMFLSAKPAPKLDSITTGSHKEQ